MTETKTDSASRETCPQCGKSVAAGSPVNACPHCLMALGMNIGAEIPTAAGSRSVLDENHIPSVEKLVSVFPQLEIQHLIGHGGMGAVYQARQVNLDRVVALKILSPRLACNPAFAERFLREAQTLAKLTHPNIVTVFESGKSSDFYYLVMEFVDGVNLRDTISANLLSAEQALAIIPQVCEALQYAHDQGVIHRDIKPENILIAKNGHVRIADFGLAKLIQPTPEQFTLTGTQQVLGTMNYMAPEQIETPNVVDHRADLYSLGVVFYELLTGELPIGRFALPSEKSADVSGRLDDLVMRTLEKDPNRRYQQASQIKTACESVGHDAPEECQDPPTVIPKANQTSQQPTSFFEGQHGSSFDKTKPLCQPFAITLEDIHGGLATGYGLMRAYESHLEIEFEVRDFLDAIKWACKTVLIPMDRIASAKIHSGLVYKYIEIQCDQFAAVQEIPDSRQGKFRVYMKKASVETAQHLVKRINQLIGKPAGAAKAHDVPVTPPQPPVKQSYIAPLDPRYVADETEVAYYRQMLQIPRMALNGFGFLMVFFFAVLIFCSFDKSWLTQVNDGSNPDLAFVIQQQLIKILKPFMSFRTEHLLFIAISALLAMLAFYTSNRIKTFRDYSFVIAALVVLCLPLHPLYLVSMPFAIWALAILIQNTSRRIFRANSNGSNQGLAISSLEQSSTDETAKLLRTILLFLFLTVCVVAAGSLVIGAFYFARS